MGRGGGRDTQRERERVGDRGGAVTEMRRERKREKKIKRDRYCRRRK